MRAFVALLAGFAILAATGCGDGQLPMNTGQLTDEQKQKIKEDDKQTMDEEGGPRDAKGRPIKQPKK